jgi:hypothetical protein
MPVATSCVGLMLMPVKPAWVSSSWYSAKDRAPAMQELDVGCSGAGGVGAGEAEHFPGHVQAVGLPGRADPAG